MRILFAFSFLLSLALTATAAQAELARDATKEVVIDPGRHLMWQDNKMPLRGSIFTWQAADAYCKNLTFADFSDWRLPSKDELLSIVDLSREPGYAKANKAFRHVFSSYHWSGSKVPPQDDPWQGKGESFK